MTDGLLLPSSGLLSKWGFSDGDEPDEVWEHFEAIGRSDEWVTADWHPILRRLVRRYLVPEIAKHHKIEVEDIGTIHNPIRASYVDGVEVAHPDDDTITLAPDSVVVPWPVVFAEAEKELDTP